MNFKRKLERSDAGDWYFVHDHDREELLKRMQARRELKARNPAYFEAMSAILFEHDPVGINYVTNCDEYDSETATIIPRLPECKSESDVRTLLQDVLLSWFTEQLVPDDDVVYAIARDIWALHCQTAEKQQHDLPY